MTEGGDAEFLQLADPYRRELLAHCYRMLGSVHDAEDLVQETYLRAWRSYEKFEGRSSLRTWLYRIATNVCLTALEGRDRRPLPVGLGAAATDPTAPLVERTEVPWLEPVPDGLVGIDGDPADAVVSRESVRLALVAALQYLPARQRAVLVLRDVLRWRAAEVAEVLGTTTTAVNSMLQRAHAQLEEAALTQDDVGEPDSPEQRALLDRYAKAIEQKDIGAIVEMFTADAVWEMPPYVGWYTGPTDIGTLIGDKCPAGPWELRMVASRGNGQPAYGMYILGEDGDFHPFQLQVVTLDRAGNGPAISHVVAFFDLRLFEKFGLPARVAAADDR